MRGGGGVVNFARGRDPCGAARRSAARRRGVCGTHSAPEARGVTRGTAHARAGRDRPPKSRPAFSLSAPLPLWHGGARYVLESVP